jgi:hypothetical protein
MSFILSPFTALLAGMMFSESSLFESSRCIPNPFSGKHWIITTVLKKWVLDVIGVCNPVGPIGGALVGGLVSTLLDVVKVGTCAIQERYGSQTIHRVCNPGWIDGVSLIRPPQHF